MAPTRKGLGSWRLQPKSAKFETEGGVLKKAEQPVNVMRRLNQTNTGANEETAVQDSRPARLRPDIEKVMADSWQVVADRLPMNKTEADLRKRHQLFLKWDVNYNGLISLAEIDRGICELPGLEKLHQSKPALIRAFNAAKGLQPGRPGSLDDDYVNKNEFRMLMVYLKLYFGLFQIFDCIDTGGDKKIDAEEFRAAAPNLRDWFCPIEDNSDVTFYKIDANGDGLITFDEFCEWAIANQQLDDAPGDDYDAATAAEPAAVAARAQPASTLRPLAQTRSYSDPVQARGAKKVQVAKPSNATLPLPKQPNRGLALPPPPPGNSNVIYLVRSSSDAVGSVASGSTASKNASKNVPHPMMGGKKGIGLWRGPKKAKGEKVLLEAEEDPAINDHRCEMTLAKPNRHKQDASLLPLRRKMQAVPMKAFGQTALARLRDAQPASSEAWA